jgi:hypothetical protein
MILLLLVGLVAHRQRDIFQTWQTDSIVIVIVNIIVVMILVYFTNIVFSLFLPNRNTRGTLGQTKNQQPTNKSPTEQDAVTAAASRTIQTSKQKCVAII